MSPAKSDIPPHNQLIPAENLKSQCWLEQIDNWTENQKMMINQKKTKTMIINFTDKFQFTTRLKLKNENVEVLKSTKLLGTIISDDLKWERNTAIIVKKLRNEILACPVLLTFSFKIVGCDITVNLPSF